MSGQLSFLLTQTMAVAGWQPQVCYQATPFFVLRLRMSKVRTDSSMRLTFYDAISGRKRLKYRYTWAIYSFSIGVAVGMLLDKIIS